MSLQRRKLSIGGEEDVGLVALEEFIATTLAEEPLARTLTTEMPCTFILYQLDSWQKDAKKTTEKIVVPDGTKLHFFAKTASFSGTSNAKLASNPNRVIVDLPDYSLQIDFRTRAVRRMPAFNKPVELPQPAVKIV